MTDSNPIYQHYVPQFLLRNFGQPRKKGKYNIHVYDKHTGHQYKSSPHKVAGENHFYDITLKNGKTFTIEDKLGKWESKVAHLIRRIIEAESLGMLNNQERSNLSTFFAIQSVRTLHQRERLMALSSSLKDSFIERGFITDGQKEFCELSEEEAKFLLMKQTMDYKEYAPAIHNKDWALLKAPKGTNFFISDNPLVTANHMPDTRKMTGFESTGVEIHIPISHQYSIAMYCKEWGRKMAEGVLTVEELKRQNPDLVAQAKAHGKDLSLDEPIDSLESFVTGNVREIKPENVEYQNWLQITHAERWIYSLKGDSDGLIADVLKQSPKLRKGRRLVVS